MPFQYKRLKIPDVLLVTPAVFKDRRGLFAEVYKKDDFEKIGIMNPFVQTNYSESKKNVLRGLHFQIHPFAQAKLLRVLEGDVFDVAVDIRRGSPTYAKWVCCKLASSKKEILYVPEGFAHGFFVLSKKAIVVYECTQIYSPKHERGLRWDDPFLRVDWPNKKPILSPRDANLPFLKDAEHDFTYGQS